MSEQDYSKLVKLCQSKRHLQTPLETWRHVGEIALKIVKGLSNGKQ